jgi:hypothetical protein
MDVKNQRRITALQANWEFFIDSWGSAQFEYFRDLALNFSGEMGVPYIDVASVTIPGDLNSITIWCTSTGGDTRRWPGLCSRKLTN